MIVAITNNKDVELGHLDITNTNWIADPTSGFINAEDIMIPVGKHGTATKVIFRTNGGFIFTKGNCSEVKVTPGMAYHFKSRCLRVAFPSDAKKEMQ